MMNFTALKKVTLPGLDFGGIRGKTKWRNIAAFHATRLPLAEIFCGLIARTLSRQANASSATKRS